MNRRSGRFWMRLEYRAEHVVYGVASMGYPAETVTDEKARIGAVAYIE